MPAQLKISVGQCSDKGRKEINQDFHGVYIPSEPQLSSKGIAIALADGISSSDVSQIASASAVKGFFEDYYCTSDAWTVKTSAERVLSAINSWLFSETRQSQYRYEQDKGYVCTFSAMVIKSTHAHIFHIGDSRIYRLRGNTLEQLTEDHRIHVTQDKSYLGRALGANQQLEIDYFTYSLTRGDVFFFATDGVYEFVDADFITKTIKENAADLDLAANKIKQQAFQQGSADNLTAQIIRVDDMPEKDVDEIYKNLIALPFPPALEARMKFDGHTIIRELYISSRSHVYLAVDDATDEQVVIKTPSIEFRTDADYLERFLLEEWIARRINSPHVLKAFKQERKRNYIYIVSEFVEGQTLTQWMVDNPKPDVETVRGIIEQIEKGLRAFHRLEMLHQDIRPENIMIDNKSTVKIIDFGSTRVAGIQEITSSVEQHNLLGTAQYSAPEYFLGELGTTRSDQFSLGIIAYQMLSGRLPYGAQVARSKTKAAQNKLNYQSVLDDEREIPRWVDEAIRKSVQPNPYKRYDELSEFIYDLRHPNKAFLNKTRAPLLERRPIAFWQGVVIMQLIVILFLLVN